MNEEGERLLPLNDGSGELGYFKCQNVYRLLIAQTGIVTMHELGFKTNRLYLTDHVPNRECTRFVKIVDVIDEGRFDDTYCFTESKRGMGVFNGILTGQCSEIMLFNDHEHTYSCVLSSMNVSLWDEWKDTDAVYWATIFLDCVVSEFIERGRNLPGLDKTIRFTEKGRALGLGQAGLHTLFMKNMIPFESFEAHMLSNKIAKHIQSQAIEATKDMASNLGEPEWCKGYGVRNTHLIAIAPTKSTALIMGGISEGVNPDPAMSFTQMTAAGEVDRLNPVLLELMKQKGVFTPKNVKQITAAQGSVQAVDWLNEDEKKVFKTAFEINQQAITRLAGTRQHFVDQGQSINYFFSADENEEYIASIFQEVFEHPQMLSAYYAYMMAGVTASKECEACM
jgi:ribonucleoside-diphosphate reductase alpha chain